MILKTAIEVLRGGKPGDRHWIPDSYILQDGEELDPHTGCGLNARGMISDHIEDPRRLTCLECRTEYAAHYLATKA